MAGKPTEKLVAAMELLEGFAQRTGLDGEYQEEPIRFLRTEPLPGKPPGHQFRYSGSEPYCQ